MNELRIKKVDAELKTIPFAARLYLNGLAKWFPALMLRYVAVEIDDPAGYFDYEMVGAKSNFDESSFAARLDSAELRSGLLAIANQHAASGPCVLVITKINGVALDYHAYISIMPLRAPGEVLEVEGPFVGLQGHAQLAFESFPSLAPTVIDGLTERAKLLLNWGDNVTVTDLLSHEDDRVSSTVVAVATASGASKHLRRAAHSFGGLLPHFVLHDKRRGAMYSIKPGFGHQVGLATPGVGLADWVNIGNGGLAWVVAEALAAGVTLPTKKNRDRAQLVAKSWRFGALRGFNFFGGIASRSLLQPLQARTFPRTPQVVAVSHATLCALLFLLLLAAMSTLNGAPEPERREEDE